MNTHDMYVQFNDLQTFNIQIINVIWFIVLRWTNWIPVVAIVNFFFILYHCIQKFDGHKTKCTKIHLLEKNYMKKEMRFWQVALRCPNEPDDTLLSLTMTLADQSHYSEYSLKSLFVHLTLTQNEKQHTSQRKKYLKKFQILGYIP